MPLPAFALGWTWLTRLHDRDSGVPYGIALAGAALFIYPQSQIWHALLS
jgi:prepilin peptidase CpaA